MQHQLEPAFETLKKPTSSKEDINAAYIHLQASYVNAEVLGEKASDELFSKLQESFELLNTHSRARHIVGFIDHITSSDRCPIETDICQNLISKDSSLLDALKLELKRAPSHRAQTALKPIIESHETQ
jgi:NAD-specific glutamate dehydrogenase